MLVVFFILLFLVSGVLTTQIELRIQEFELNIKNNRLRVKYKIKVYIQIFKYIKIKIIELTPENLRILGIKREYNEMNFNFKNKIQFRKIKVMIEKYNFNMELGTPSIKLTTGLTVLVSSIIPQISNLPNVELSEGNYNNQKYQITPDYSKISKLNIKLNANIKLKYLLNENK